MRAGYKQGLAWLILLFLSSRAPCVAWAQSTPAAFDEIRTRVLAGDDAGALGLIAGLPAAEGGAVEMRYLAARLQERRGRIDAALAALPDELTGLPELVAKDACERRALWLARSGNCSDAKPLLLALIDKAQDTTLRLAAAQCALDEADVASALTLLLELKGTTAKTFNARFMLARAQALGGERAAAIAGLRALYIEKPEHARSFEAERELRRLTPKLEWSDDERLQRAANLITALRPQPALDELDRLRAPKAKAVRARSLHFRGMALFQMRTRYPEAAKVLAQAAALGGEYEASDAYHAARALARSDRDAEAVKAYRAFAKRYPNSSFAAEAMHSAAWLELRHDFAGGEAHMRAFLADAEKKGERDAAQAALWELAFYLFDHARFSQALPLFERYAASSDTAMIRGRGFYWAGRAALLAKQQPRGIARFTDALAVEPLHWYAQLARARLVALGQSVGDPFDVIAAPAAVSGSAAATPAPPTPEPSALPLPAEVQLYAQLGLYSDALAALRAREDSLRASVKEGDALLALLATYYGLDEYARPYRLVVAEHSGLLSQKPNATVRTLWQALFPRPYAQHVSAASGAEKLPEEFVYSIMRKESEYDPSVVSSADAIGLLQLIEPTAKTMARELGMTNFKRAHLFQPAINIRLGAHYLGDLRTRYRGQYVPAIAAYNAGEYRIDQWLARADKRDKKRIELDRFVEDIPIEQTRNYVRRVIANWARYRYLADPSQPWPIELPELLTR